MTRDEFLKRLRRGLAGLPGDTVDDILADHAAHFDAAHEEGRSDAEVAAALGDPGRLSRELKLEAGIRRWEEGRTPSSAAGAILAFLGLGALDILVLLPLLLPLLAVLVGFYAAVIALFLGGGFAAIAGPFSGFPGGPLIAILGGLGTMAAATGLGAMLLLLSIWLVNGLMWFGRLHYQVLQPAIEPQP